MNGLDKKFAESVIKYRWSVIIGSLLLLVVSAFGLRSLEFDSDLRVFFSDDNPQLKLLQEQENTYTKRENIIFIIAPKDKSVFTPTTLAVVEEVTAAAWQTPFSNRVDSLSNFQHSRAEGDDLIVGDLIVNAKHLTTEKIRAIETIALNEPLLVNRLLSPDSKVTGVYVNIIFPSKKQREVERVAQFARNLRDTFRSNNPGIEFYLAGTVMFDVAFSEIGQGDVITLTPILLAILVAVVGIAVRSLAATIITMVVIVFSTLTAMGLAGWLGISINPASANAPTIILTLAVADSVHILVMLCRLLSDGKTKHRALVESLSFNLQAVFLTSLTTVIGFLTMNFSDAPPFHDLGNIVAMGIAAAFLYSIFLLPALVAVWPATIKLRPITGRWSVFNAMASFVIKRQKYILWITTSSVALLTFAALKNELNDNWIQYFSEDVEERIATDYLERYLSGSDLVEYSFKAGEPDGIYSPTYLQILDDFAVWLRQQPNVVHVNTIAEVFKRLNKNMHHDNPSWYRLPQQRALAAQYLLLYEMSLPIGLDLNDQINVDKSASRVVVILKNRGTRALLDLDEQVQAWLKQNTPDYMHTQGTGLSAVWAKLSQRNIVNMLVAAFGALIAISITLVITLKRIDMGLLSLIPNLVPALMGFGIWALWVGQIGLGLSVVASMTLGIVVDDTVHFISKYLRARRKLNLTPQQGIYHAFGTVGPAMWITTVALTIGFLVLTLSDYTMSGDMGLLSAITIAIALVMDFLLLPAVILLVELKRKTIHF